MYLHSLKKSVKLAIQLKQEGKTFSYEWCPNWEATRRDHDIMIANDVLDLLVNRPINKWTKQELFDCLNDIDMIFSQYR